jgi:hypothetical protein
VDRVCYATVQEALAPFGRGKNAEEIIAERWPGDNVALQFVTRSPVSPAASTSASWAGNVLIDATADFVGSLAPSAFAKLMAAGTRIPWIASGRKSVKVPRRSGAAKPVSSIGWIAETQPIPVKQYQLDTVQLGPMAKLAIIAVLTREMADYTYGQENISTLLREDAVASLDAWGFSTQAGVAGTSPAGLLASATLVTATTGGDSAAMVKDIDLLSGVIADAGGSSRVIIAATRQAFALQDRWPNNNPPTVWASAQLAPGTVIAIDPGAFVSSLGAARIEARIDTLHMESATALPIVSGTTTASPVVSAFQQDLVVVKCVLPVAYTMVAPLVAYCTATWGAAS